MTILVVLISSIVVFTLVYFTPGDPVKIMMPPEATVAELEAKRHELGLDQPYLVQLLPVIMPHTKQASSRATAIFAILCLERRAIR